MRERRPRGSDADAPGSRADDWLGPVGDLDWSEDGEPSAPRPRPPRAGAVPSIRMPSRRVETPDDVISRRRAVAGLVLALLVLGALAAILILARSGGNSSSPPPLATTPTTPTTTAEQTAPSPSPSPSPTPAATPKVTLPPKGAIRPGDKGAGSGVRTLQRALATLGYDPGTIDGSYGPKTEAAVVSFQQKNGLGDDGVVGPKTAAKLNAALAAKGVTG